MALPTAFDADLYREFRPDYPEALFAPLIKLLNPLNPPATVLDIGCGTGLSLAPFLRLGTNYRLTGVDRDPHMLDQARASGAGSANWVLGDAEKLPFESSSFDAVISGSAYHWFEAERFSGELNRVLRSGGYLFLFEYQFPRALQNEPLNAWIKTRFNREWKAPGQRPRGSLREMTTPFRSSREWKEIPIQNPKLILSLTPAELHGQIVSQSRYLHSEATLDEKEIHARRSALLAELTGFFGTNSRLEFDFYLSGFLFRRV